jgi:spore germination cell wall hydrolase CwlJ-like protein
LSWITIKEAIVAKLKFAVAVATFALLPISFAYSPKTSHNDDSRCIAAAIFEESRGEGPKGQRAVYDVLTHRALHSGKSFCEVVKAKAQFSFVRTKGIKPYTEERRELLVKTLSTPKVLKRETFTHFYSGPKPKWAYAMKCVKIGNHSFCEGKEKT